MIPRNYTLEVMVGMVVVVLVGLSFSGSQTAQPLPALPRTIDMVAMPLVEASEMWAGQGDDFGDEGVVATMIGAYPAPIQSPTTMVVLSGSEKNPAVVAIREILFRWSKRVKREFNPAKAISATGTPPTVAVVTPCDPDLKLVREFTGCSECSQAALESRLAKLRYDVVNGPFLLIPSDRLYDGLILMNKVFNYHPGDLLFLGGGQDEKVTCPEGDSILYKLAVRSVTKRLETENPNLFKLKLDSLRRSLKALPNYCDGIHTSSQCRLMKGYEWDRRYPVRLTQTYNCSAPHSVALPTDVKGAALELISTSWPQCHPNCKPSRGIAFVKTHKTAGSTLEGILHRLCINRRQKCFIHSGKFVNLAYPEQRALVEYPYKGVPALSVPYDLFVAHTMNVPELVEEIVPSSQGHVLSIVRDPIWRYYSHWNFWLSSPTDILAKGRYSWRANELDQFCDKVLVDKELAAALNSEPLNIRISLNNMARQLMGCTVCGNEATIRKRMDKLLDSIRAPDSKYLILISEKMSESLMLFRREYGLKMADVVYMSKNIGSYEKAKPQTAECIKKINSLDSELYETALQVHTKKVAALGQEFQDEVAKFNNLLKETYAGCGQGKWGCKDGANDPDPLCRQCQDIKDAFPEEILKEHFKACKAVN